MRCNRSCVIGLALMVATSQFANADVITGGSAAFTINEGKAAAVYEFDALFNDATSRADTLSLPAPGNASFIETPADPSTGTVTITDPIRATGAPIITGDGRTRQQTTLNFDPANILGTWSAASSDLGSFVGSASDEQIAFTTMQRYTGPFTGVLLYGDFAIRYSPSRAGTQVDTNGDTIPDATLSGLVIASNIDFNNAAFADIANASIGFSNNQLTINGDLLVSGGLALLNGGGQNTPFGTISVVASVPEPASLVVLSLGVTIALARRRRHREHA